MRSRMLSNEEVPLWVVSFGALFPFVAVLAACVCCRKRTPKNELLGLAGMVTITNPEENINRNHQQSDELQSSVVIDDGSCAEAQSNKRATTANRSLPDIPIYSDRLRPEEGATLWENEVNGDTSSELYATVEENKHATEPLVDSVNLQANSTVTQKRELFREERKSSEQSSLSQTDDNFSPYSQLKSEHPYDRVRKNEHPYAQVGSSGQLENKTSSRVNAVPREGAASSSDVVLRTARPVSSQVGGIPSEPVPPPRTRRSTSHGSLSPDGMGSTPDIPAATAIAGRVSANQELPYMTPPIVDQQANFSGDSQDSKGYTSISVREPLANIKAQTLVTRGRNSSRERTDPHYATVSDDSATSAQMNAGLAGDGVTGGFHFSTMQEAKVNIGNCSYEMYAAIDDPNQLVYTSGSETYAQIQPVARLPAMSAVPEPEEAQYSAPQPPSVDSLKHVAQVHSRQASSSSATSSVANVGSPKPEKRQANSPLPPPPASSPELQGGTDRKSNSRLDVGAAKNLEEMYAKVMKKKRNAPSEGELQSDEILTGGLPQPRQERLSVGSGDHRVDSVSCTSMDSRDSEYRSLQDAKQADTDSTSSSDHNLSQESRVMFELNVPLNGLSSSSHEALYSSSGSPPHVFVEPGYESLNQPHSILYSDPGYERVCRQPSENDPNYEELHPRNERTFANGDEPGYISITEQNVNTVGLSYTGVASTVSGEFYDCVGNSLFPGYESVCPQPSAAVEPDYASLGRKRYSGPFRHGDDDENDDSGDPNYESVSSGIQDPNYEMVNHEDPNYESVNYSVNLVGDEPPYERLNNEARDSDSDMTVAEYERLYINPVDVAQRPNPTKTEGQCSEISGHAKGSTEPGYETVGKVQHGFNMAVTATSDPKLTTTSNFSTQI